MAKVKKMALGGVGIPNTPIGAPNIPNQPKPMAPMQPKKIGTVGRLFKPKQPMPPKPMPPNSNLPDNRQNHINMVNMAAMALKKLHTPSTGGSGFVPNKPNYDGPAYEPKMIIGDPPPNKYPAPVGAKKGGKISELHSKPMPTRMPPKQKLALQPNGTFAPAGKSNLPPIGPIGGKSMPPPNTGGMIATPPSGMRGVMPPPPMGSTPPPIFQKGGKVKSTSSASTRGDGIAQRGKTKGRFV